MHEINNAPQRTPEQIAADLKVTSEAEAATLQRKQEAAGELHFLNGNKVYKPLMPAVFIPGLGRRSAIELCTDGEAQAYLLKEGCVGSVIEEVL